MTHFLFLISVSLLVYILISESHHPIWRVILTSYGGQRALLRDLRLRGQEKRSCEGLVTVPEHVVLHPFLTTVLAVVHHTICCAARSSRQLTRVVSSARASIDLRLAHAVASQLVETPQLHRRCAALADALDSSPAVLPCSRSAAPSGPATARTKHLKSSHMSSASGARACRAVLVRHRPAFAATIPAGLLSHPASLRSISLQSAR